MIKRVIISAGIIAACFGIMLAVLALLPPRSGVTKANYDRIERGMTLTEVERIFGRKATTSRGEPIAFFCAWENEDGSFAEIGFDGIGKVNEKFHWVQSEEHVGHKLTRAIRWPWW